MADWPSDPLTEARLRDYLATEVRKAELDYPRLPARHRPARWIGPGMALLATFMLVAGGFLLFRPPTHPVGVSVSSPSATADASPRLTFIPVPASPPTSSAEPPLVIGGVPVFRGDAIAEKIAAMTDDTPFLIGGYVLFVQSDCLVPPDLPSSPLTAPCGDGWIISSSPVMFRPVAPGASGRPLVSPYPVASPYRLVVGPNVADWTASQGSPLALRVHVHDARASACAASIKESCERAIVVEAVVWRSP